MAGRPALCRLRSGDDPHALLTAGAPADYADFMTGIFLASVGSGALPAVTGDIPAVTGHPPAAFTEYGRRRLAVTAAHRSRLCSTAKDGRLDRRRGRRRWRHHRTARPSPRRSRRLSRLVQCEGQS